MRIFDGVLTNDTEFLGKMKPFVRVDLNEDKKEGTNMKESDLANTDNGEEKPNWGGAVI